MKTTFEDYEELAASYNIIRDANKGIIFDVKTFASKIAFTKLRRNQTKLWVKYGLAVKAGKGQYKFPDEPVLWSKLKYAIEEMRKAQHNYNSNYLEKKKSKKEVEVKETDLKDLLSTWNISLDEVAKYLVSTGNYRVEKRIETWNAI